MYKCIAKGTILKKSQFKRDLSKLKWFPAEKNLDGKEFK